MHQTEVLAVLYRRLGEHAPATLPGVLPIMAQMGSIARCALEEARSNPDVSVAKLADKLSQDLPERDEPGQASSGNGRVELPFLCGINCVAGEDDEGPFGT